jgi:hypothetical protein
LAARAGVDHLQIEPLTPVFTGKDYRAFYREKHVPREEAAESVEAARARARELGIEHFTSHYLEEPVQVERCAQPWLTLGVRVDGSTIRCCGSPERMGHLEEDFWAAWNSKEFRKVRKSLAKGSFPRSCRSCVAEGRCPEFNVDLLEKGPPHAPPSP